MGLNINRNANPARLEKSSLQSIDMSTEDLDSLMSARHAYALTTSDDSRRPHPSILEKVRPDDDGRLDSEATKTLFNRLWSQVRRNRVADVVLDMFEVTSLANRFARELAVLRRHLVRQHRRVVLSHLRAECSYLQDIK